MIESTDVNIIDLKKKHQLQPVLTCFNAVTTLVQLKPTLRQ